jgi:hypothetical protein
VITAGRAGVGEFRDARATPLQVTMNELVGGDE